jgi:hypothetical protein
MENKIGDTHAHELFDMLKNVKFPHPVKGDIVLGSLFLAHSGFICLVHEIHSALLDDLRKIKKDLDTLGILLIVLAKKTFEDKEILVISLPEILESFAPHEHLFLFIEEKLKKAFIVPSPDEFLDVAVDYIDLDAQSRRHITQNVLKALQKKGRMLDAGPIEEEGTCTGACAHCGE